MGTYIEGKPKRGRFTEKGMWFLRANPYGLMLALFVLGLDQLSKALVVANIGLYSSVPEEGFFRLTYAQNFGTVFGFFRNLGDVIVWFSLFVAVLLLIGYIFAGGRWRFALPLGLMLGGAFGNIIDRFRFGYVVDFIDVGPWPIFNVADSAITVGAILIAFYAFTEKRENPEQEPAGKSAEVEGEGKAARFNSSDEAGIDEAAQRSEPVKDSVQNIPNQAEEATTSKVTHEKPVD